MKRSNVKPLQVLQTTTVRWMVVLAAKPAKNAVVLTAWARRSSATLLVAWRARQATTSGRPWATSDAMAEETTRT